MKSSQTKLLNFPFILLSGILISLFGCTSQVGKNVQSDIDSIATRWVPDQRIELCKIIAKTGTDGKLILTGETTNQIVKQEIIKTLHNQGIELIDSILILPDTIKNEKFMGLVTLSVINLRKQPNHRSELVSQSILGTPLLILKNEDSWLMIQTPDHYIAWTEASSVKLMDKAEMASWKTADRVIFIKNSGWISASVTAGSGVIGDIVAGSIIEKTGESGSYIKIVLPDRRSGFVNSNEVMDFDLFRKVRIPDEEKVIMMASSLLGIPYLWGGTSAKGVDCSGFVQTVFFMNGLILMRDASLQALHGETIDLSNGFSLLRKGDLLFFGSIENSKARVTHVAIYTGNNDYINSSGRVLVNSLDSTSSVFVRYRLNSLLAARRIIGVENDPGIVSLSKHIWY